MSALDKYIRRQGYSLSIPPPPSPNPRQQFAPFGNADISVDMTKLEMSPQSFTANGADKESDMG
jgi:hypothetical protein